MLQVLTAASTNTAYAWVMSISFVSSSGIINTTHLSIKPLMGFLGSKQRKGEGNEEG